MNSTKRPRKVNRKGFGGDNYIKPARKVFSKSEDDVEEKILRLSGGEGCTRIVIEDVDNFVLDLRDLVRLARK